MRKFGPLRSLLVAISLLLLSGIVCASVITYPDRNSFYAANPGVTIQGWDTLPNGTLITSLDGITYLPSTGPGTALVTSAFLPLSPPNTLGESINGFFLATDTMTFIFPSPVFAFGISINTFDTSTGGYLATDNLGDVIQSHFDPFPGFGTGEFIGFNTTNGFTSITITAPGGFAFTLDDLAYSFSPGGVPEPGSLFLLGTGLFGLARVARKRLGMRS